MVATNNAINLSLAGVPYYNGTGGLNAFTAAAPGTSGFPLVSTGPGATPSFSLLSIGGGGTGTSTLTQNGILVAGATAVNTTLLTNGQLLIGSTGVAPVAATLTQGTGISITNAAGSITIAVNGSGGTSWNVITVATSTPLVAANGYIAADTTGTVQLQLPASPAVGDTYYVTGRSNSMGWTVLTTAGQTIDGGISTATTSLSSTYQTDSVKIVCTTGGASAIYTVIDVVGNVTYT